MKQTPEERKEAPARELDQAQEQQEEKEEPQIRIQATANNQKTRETKLFEQKIQWETINSGEFSLQKARLMKMKMMCSDKKKQDVDFIDNRNFSDKC